MAIKKIAVVLLGVAIVLVVTGVGRKEGSAKVLVEFTLLSQDGKALPNCLVVGSWSDANLRNRPWINRQLSIHEAEPRHLSLPGASFFGVSNNSGRISVLYAVPYSMTLWDRITVGRAKYLRETMSKQGYVFLHSGRLATPKGTSDAIWRGAPTLQSTGADEVFHVSFGEVRLDVQ